MRRSGRTTRIVDEAIQTLFTKGEVTICDHYYGDKFQDRVESEASHRRANEFAFNILMRRLRLEHDLIFNKLKIIKDKFTIKLIEL